MSSLAACTSSRRLDALGCIGWLAVIPLLRRVAPRMLSSATVTSRLREGVSDHGIDVSSWRGQWCPYGRPTAGRTSAR